MLGCTYVGDGNTYSVGNVSHVTGQSGAFTSGMGYDFPYQQPCDNYIDQISSNGGTIAFRSQDNHGRVVYYSGAGNTYRSIHATCVFGALRNGSQTKAQLMTEYMNYLTQTIGVQEITDDALQTISLSPNPCYRDMTVRFSLVRSAPVTISIYNNAGQHIRTLVDQHVDAGIHTMQWSGKDDHGREVGSGVYLVTIQVNDQSISKTIVRLD
jgi:hypothetical protein